MGNYLWANLSDIFLCALEPYATILARKLVCWKAKGSWEAGKRSADAATAIAIKIYTGNAAAAATSMQQQQQKQNQQLQHSCHRLRRRRHHRCRYSSLAFLPFGANLLTSWHGWSSCKPGQQESLKETARDWAKEMAREECVRAQHMHATQAIKWGQVCEFEMPLEMERGLRFEEILSSYFLILLEKDYSEKTVQQELINVLLALILYYYNCWKHYYRPIHYIINIV